MIQLKQREKIIAAVVIGVIALFLFQKFFLSRAIGRVKGMHNRIRLEEAALKTNLDLQKKKDMILSESETYKSYFQIDRTASDREAVGIFVKELERMAQESNLSVANLNPQIDPEEADGRKKYKADMRVEADFQQLCNFLYKVSTSKLPIKLSKLSLSPRDDAAIVLKVEMVVVMVMP